MKQIQMEASLRTGLKKNAMNRLRTSGQLPAVVYGQGQEALSVQMDSKAFSKKMSLAGKNAMIQLSISGGDQPQQTMVAVKEVQRHPVTNDILHVDFLKISMDKPMETAVPLHFVGNAPGVKEGGMLSIVHRELNIKCLPALIPETIEIDVKNLHIGNSLTIKDIALAEGIEVYVDANEPLVHVVAPRVDTGVAKAGEEAGATQQPEVIGEKERQERQANKGKA